MGEISIDIRVKLFFILNISTYFFCYYYIKTLELRTAYLHGIMKLNKSNMNMGRLTYKGVDIYGYYT